MRKKCMPVSDLQMPRRYDDDSHINLKTPRDVKNIKQARTLLHKAIAWRIGYGKFTRISTLFVRKIIRLLKASRITKVISSNILERDHLNHIIRIIIIGFCYYIRRGYILKRSHVRLLLDSNLITHLGRDEYASNLIDLVQDYLGINRIESMIPRNDPMAELQAFTGYGL